MMTIELNCKIYLNVFMIVLGQLYKRLWMAIVVLCKSCINLDWASTIYQQQQMCESVKIEYFVICSTLKTQSKT